MPHHSAASDTVVDDLIQRYGIGTADAAIDLIDALTIRFRLAVTCWNRPVIAAALSRVAGGADRTLTEAEWDRLRATPAWAQLVVDAIDLEAAWELLCSASRQAGLDCARCGLPIDAALSQSLGHCANCRAHLGTATILVTGCPANGFHAHTGAPLGPDAWELGVVDTCLDCGTPVRLQPIAADPAARLAAGGVWQWVAINPY
jgi:hypothetical protein